MSKRYEIHIRGWVSYKQLDITLDSFPAECQDDALDKAESMVAEASRSFGGDWHIVKCRKLNGLQRLIRGVW